MTPQISNKINAFIQSEEALHIFNSEEFYFQKGQDTLREFLDYELTEDLKNYLVQNVKEYDELKQFFETSPDILDFGKLLFSLISYCDSKSYRKNELNQYSDKRVLAFAFVRMNNWVEQLLSYKFGLPIPDGSPKNAIEYLINPMDNFTMLSENHREQLSENLFNKKYGKTVFKEEVFKYFKPLTLQPSNPQNYSHLLSRLCYQIETEWKLSIIGIVSPDRTGWQEDAINITKDGSYIALWNHKRPNGTNETLKGLRQSIDDKGYFEIFYTSNYNVNYVAEIIDFVSTQKELKNADWLGKFGNVEWYNDDFTEYNDEKKFASWIYLARKIYKVNPNNYSDFKYYKTYGYPSVGGQAPVVSYKSSLKKKENTQMTNYKNLLKYKKQIILQGPPGTGKTKVANEIAEDLMEDNFEKSHFVHDDFLKIKINDVLKTPFDGSFFAITEVKRDEQFFMVKPYNAKNTYKVTYEQIHKCLNAKGWNDGSDKWNHSGNGPYLVAIAKEIVVLKRKELKEKCCSIIQFHPSYTYEDFVRGIMVKPNPDGDGVLYEAENKILGTFADEAFQNYKLNKEPISISVSDVELFDLFISDIKEKIADSDEQRFSLTDAVYLFEPDEKRFKYKGDNWIAHGKGLNMKFSELQKIIASNVTERAQVKQLDGVEELTKQHATYFIKVVEMFYEFRSNHSSNQGNKQIKTTLKNYVLIIDEINRANLSSVLGELIYALEYRGESVDSMYAIDKNNKLTLPPNLYIIGTMNTADRSVGHIDYAIRRRFAFVDVLPEILSINDFEKDLFVTVAKLFVKELDSQWESSSYLSPEFAPKDVMLGHSYFIQQYEKDDRGNNIIDRPYDFKMRVKYEIVPILREYIKDGILNEKAINEIDKIEEAYLIN